MIRTSRRTTRLIAAAALMVPALLLGSVAVSSATPRENLAAGQSKLDSIQHTLEVLSEQMNTAQAKLDEVNGRLADARSTKDAAEQEAARMREQLSQRAVAAYVGAGSQLEGLLGAEDFNDFSDRLQYAGALAQNDADLAARSDAAGERAQWAAEQFASVAAEQKKALENLKTQQDRFRAQFETQQAKVADLQKAYKQWQAAQAAARRQAAAEAAAAQEAASTGGGSPTGGGGGWAPPPNLSGAQAAIAAATRQIGVPYVWGTMNPGVSFDCSGLTAYAWGVAGVSLPHSSAMQASMTPNVDYSDLQPGDLVFFYDPISHVGLYVGEGIMIDASHSGPGGEVARRTVYTSSFNVGGRVT
jgi:cell wall-associated NlpC family hydrolase